MRFSPNYRFNAPSSPPDGAPDQPMYLGPPPDQAAAAPPILIVVHQETSTPGRIGDMLQAKGYTLDIRRPCLGQPLPATMDGHAGCVVFGGPMSANDDHLDFIRRELDFIPVAVTSGKPYFGVCLGAQLMARAGGARVAPHPDGWHEIGYYPVRPTPRGRAVFPRPLHVFQWHGEGFELPRGAVRLAGTAWYPNQAMQIGAHAFGVQFHPEVTGGIMQRWTTMAGHRLVLPGAQARDLQRAHYARHDPGIAAWLDRFLDRWLGRPLQDGGEEAVGALAAGRQA